MNCKGEKKRDYSEHRREADDWGWAVDRLSDGIIIHMTFKAVRLSEIPWGTSADRKKVGRQVIRFVASRIVQIKQSQASKQNKQTNGLWTTYLKTSKGWFPSCNLGTYWSRSCPGKKWKYASERCQKKIWVLEVRSMVRLCHDVF